MRFIAQELQRYMAALGIRKVNDLIGRTDLLKIKDGEEEKAKHIDLSAILDASFAVSAKKINLIQKINLISNLRRQWTKRCSFLS